MKTLLLILLCSGRAFAAVPYWANISNPLLGNSTTYLAGVMMVYPSTSTAAASPAIWLDGLNIRLTVRSGTDVATISATGFHGDGSNLTGVIHSTQTSIGDEVTIHKAGVTFSALASSVTLQGNDYSIADIAASTGTNTEDIAAIKISTGALQTQADNIAASTGTLTVITSTQGVKVDELAASTGVLTVALSSTGARVGVLGIITSTQGVKIGDIATSTGTLTVAMSTTGVRVDAIAASTGTLQEDLATEVSDRTQADIAHSVATSTHGATAANTASRIVLRDGSGNFTAGNITATFYGDGSNISGVPGDDLGDHIATKNLNMGDFAIVDIRTSSVTDKGADGYSLYLSSGIYAPNGTVNADNLIGDLTGDVIGNADTATTATNLAATPGDCSVGEFYTGLTAAGTRTCAAPTGYVMIPATQTLTGINTFATYTNFTASVTVNGTLNVIKPGDTPDVYATGGTLVNIDGYNIHTFTEDGTLTVVGDGDFEILVVGGGGGGGSKYGGGGGGGGGVIYDPAYAVTAGGISITVGTGGPGGADVSTGTNGGNSIFGSSIAYGGGGGAAGDGTYPGQDGATGGGASWSGTQPKIAGTGHQGGDGGAYSLTPERAGGGGGAGGNGVSGTISGDGGIGIDSNISGILIAYGGGGGGASNSVAPGVGVDGGGDGGRLDAAPYDSTAGTDGLGGGGGGNERVGTGIGGDGGDGIVIVRYPADLPVYVITATTAGYVGINTNVPTHSLHVSSGLIWNDGDGAGVTTTGQVYADTVYAVGEISGSPITDRTPYPETLAIAYEEIESVTRDINNPKHIDYAKLHKNLRIGKNKKKIIGYQSETTLVVSTTTMQEVEETIYTPIYAETESPRRNLSELISALVEVVKDLSKRIGLLEDEQ